MEMREVKDNVRAHLSRSLAASIDLADGTALSWGETEERPLLQGTFSPLPSSSPAPFIRSLTTSFALIKQDINGDWTAEKSGLVYLDFVPRMCVPFLSPSPPPSFPTQD